MIPELKIILEDSPAMSQVYVGDERIGFIKYIKIEVDVESVVPVVEIGFFDLFKDPETASPNIKKELERMVKLVQEVPNVKITYCPMWE